MNSVSSSEDIKPPPGLQNLGNINYQCTSPGGMSKHICSICGDRSSGNITGWGGGGGQTNVHSRSPQPSPTRYNWGEDNKEFDFRVTCQAFPLGLLVQCWLALWSFQVLLAWNQRADVLSQWRERRTSWAQILKKKWMFWGLDFLQKTHFESKAASTDWKISIWLQTSSQHRHSGRLLRCFRSYLEDRVYLVAISDHKSKQITMNMLPLGQIVRDTNEYCHSYTLTVLYLTC